MSFLHVGYQVALGENLMKIMKENFNEYEFSDQVTLAVLHKESDSNFRNDNNADNETLKIWYEKAKQTVAIVHRLYYYKKSRNPPKNTKFDLTIIARITIDGRPFYLNIFNNSGNFRPIEAKKFICAHEKSFKEIQVDSEKLECTPYSKMLN